MMNMMEEDLPVGTEVLTPSGRRAIVKKHLAGESKKDYFSRVICYYVGGTSRFDYVTLQPHLVKPVSKVRQALESVIEQGHGKA